MNIIPYREMWLEMDGSDIPVLRIAFTADEQSRESPVVKGEGFQVVIAGTHGSAMMRLDRLSSFKGQQVYEARPMTLAPQLGPAPSDAWRLIWSPLLART